MGRVYTASGGQSVGSGAVETALVITAPADAVERIRRIRCSQEDHVVSEMYLVELLRASAAGSGGSSVTPAPKETGDSACGATVATGPTTEPTYSAVDPLLKQSWNAVLGFEIYWPEGEGPVLSPSAIAGIRISNTNGDETFTPLVTVELDEIGG